MAWCSDHGLPHSALLAWAPEDRAKLAAYLMESGRRCSSCGTSGWEWEADRGAYEPVVEVCPGCYAKETASEDSAQMAGARVVLLPAEVAAARREAGSRLPVGDDDD